MCLCVSVYDSPRGPTTKLLCIEYDVKIDLHVLDLSKHYHGKVHLRALPLWTHRLLIIVSGTHVAYMYI